MKGSIFIFVFIMWIILIFGGGIVVTVLGPINVTGFSDLNQVISSGIKAIIAIILVIIWILILFEIRNRLFHKEIKS
ncbi:MAG: hypothetical protein NPMRTH4_10003 [Nitrosopumilales archaeon]|nr:MAG: hypothetical protein NPMRTH4_10003 [Nitrosopumilales archaeon]